MNQKYLLLCGARWSEAQLVSQLGAQAGERILLEYWNILGYDNVKYFWQKARV